MSTARVVPFVVLSPSVSSDGKAFVRSRLRTSVPSGIIRPHLPSTEKAGNLPGATPAGTPCSSVSYERIYIEHAELIEGVLTLICRRHRLAGMEADDFRSIARLKLVDNDYEVLRKFQGRSSLRTYLTIVLDRVFLDYRNAQWGKWRPSAEAQRLGPVALRLEQLMSRDGFTFDEAVEMLRTQLGARQSRDELYEMASRLPTRLSRKPQGEEAIGHVEDPAPSPDAIVEREELRPRAALARAALDRAVAALDPQERLIVRLKFVNGLGVVDIARTLKLEQRPLYRRLDQILKGLRQSLESQGVTAQAVAALLSETWSDLAGPEILKTNFGKTQARPSM
jgi:RNA polymerase sigma factor (sigma-70 family)